MAKPKLELQLIALADQVISADDGKKSIIGIFDKIFVRQVPSHHPRMALFITLLGVPGTQDEVTLKFLSPENSSLDAKQLTFQFGENGKANLIINLEGFPIQTTGEHTIVVEYDGEELGDYSFTVVQVQDGAANTSQVVN